MKEGFKAAAVFIGTVIGAGFATGQEVLLYFKNSTPTVAIFSGLLLGVLCTFFMWLGSCAGEKTDSEFLYNKHTVLSDVFVFICSYITFIAMFSGAEVLIASTLGIAHMGIVTVLAATIFATYGLKGLKFLNVIAVPLIVVFIIIIFFKNGLYSKAGNYNFFNGIAYVAMNIMLAGNVMFRIGRTSSKQTALTAGIASGIGLAVMLYALTLLVDGRGGEMPVYIAARELGLQYVAGVVIFLAVFTTMVSALEQAAEKIEVILPHKKLAVPTVCLMSYPVTLILSFSQTVDYLYPVVSVSGIILLAVAVYRGLQIKHGLYRE